MRQVPTIAIGICIRKVLTYEIKDLRAAAVKLLNVTRLSLCYRGADVPRWQFDFRWVWGHSNKSPLDNHESPHHFQQQVDNMGSDEKKHTKRKAPMG